MPIYEYSCRGCSHQFEALVRGSAVPACPECHGAELDRVFSLSAVASTSSTRSLVKRDTTRRDKTQAAERIYTQREYERNHD